jgi:hypothetical protein
VVEIFDATVRDASAEGPPRADRGERAQVNVPGLRGRSHFEVDGVVKGGIGTDARTSRLGRDRQRDSSIATQLARSISYISALPVKRASGHPQRPIDLQSDVTHNRLRASGKITLNGLQLETEGGAGTFMGMSRRAVLAELTEKHGEISADFVIEGDIDKPEVLFEPSPQHAARVLTREVTGVNLGGLVRVGNTRAEGRGRWRAAEAWAARSRSIRRQTQVDSKRGGEAAMNG